MCLLALTCKNVTPLEWIRGRCAGSVRHRRRHLAPPGATRRHVMQPGAARRRPAPPGATWRHPAPRGATWCRETPPRVPRCSARLRPATQRPARGSGRGPAPRGSVDASKVSRGRGPSWRPKAAGRAATARTHRRDRRELACLLRSSAVARAGNRWSGVGFGPRLPVPRSPVGALVSPSVAGPQGRQPPARAGAVRVAPSRTAVEPCLPRAPARTPRDRGRCAVRPQPSCTSSHRTIPVTPPRTDATPARIAAAQRAGVKVAGS